MSIFFFFQAEDGIRDYKVTGVQTCALPICSRAAQRARQLRRAAAPARCCPRAMEVAADVAASWCDGRVDRRDTSRSEERRVGKEGRSRWSPYHLKKKKMRKYDTVVLSEND